jgi:hypothetical protein
MLSGAGVEAGDRLAFVVADLLSDDGWPEAVDGVERTAVTVKPIARP